MISEQLQKKINQSIALLQSVGKRYDGEIEIAYSGGKDSDVILQLAKEAGIRYRAIYKNTTIDPPGTIRHVQEMNVEMRRPKMTFFQLVAKKGFPSRLHRFCCEYLKEYKVLDKTVIGVRKAESTKRAARYNEPTECRWYGAKTEKNHVEQIYPILEWTDDDVLEFVLDRKLKLAPVYYNRGGKSMSRNASAAWVVRFSRSVSASSSSRRIPVLFGHIFELERNTWIHTPIAKFAKSMLMYMHGFVGMFSLVVKQNDRQ